MDEMVQKARDFHGHLCAGLTIGIRAAQIALRESDYREKQTDDKGITAIYSPVDAPVVGMQITM